MPPYWKSYWTSSFSTILLVMVPSYRYSYTRSITWKSTALNIEANFHLLHRGFAFPNWRIIEFACKSHNNISFYYIPHRNILGKLTMILTQPLRKKCKDIAKYQSSRSTCASLETWHQFNNYAKKFCFLHSRTCCAWIYVYLQFLHVIQTYWSNIWFWCSKRWIVISPTWSFRF